MSPQAFLNCPKSIVPRAIEIETQGPGEEFGEQGSQCCLHFTHGGYRAENGRMASLWHHTKSSNELRSLDQ